MANKGEAIRFRIDRSHDSNELVARAKAGFRGGARLVEANDRAALLVTDPQVAQRIENGGVGRARISRNSAAGSSAAEASAGGAAAHDKQTGKVQKSVAAISAGEIADPDDT